MKYKWKKSLLSEVAVFKNGKKRPKDIGNVPVYGGNGILAYTKKGNFNECVSIGRVGVYCGNVYLSRSECWISDNAIAAIPKENTSIEYLYYLLRNLQLNKMRIGSGQPLLTQGILNIIEVDVPDKEYQYKIATVLKSIDDKIETNTAINKNLEEQLQLLFQHTFLDEVHDDWPIKRLGDYLSLNRGLSYKGKYLSENEGVPMINLGNILPNSVFREEKLKFYTGEFKEKVVVKPGDVVVANTDLTQSREVLGSAITVPDLGYTTMICSHHISIIKECTISKHFILGMLNSPSYRERVISFATGTTVLALPSETILNCEFALPPEKIVMEYDSFAELVRQKSEQLRKENLQLNSLRDNLLPKLMSGELDVSEISI